MPEQKVPWDELEIDWTKTARQIAAELNKQLGVRISFQRVAAKRKSLGKAPPKSKVSTIDWPPIDWDEPISTIQRDLAAQGLEVSYRQVQNRRNQLQRTKVYREKLPSRKLYVRAPTKVLKWLYSLTPVKRGRILSFAHAHHPESPPAQTLRGDYHMERFIIRTDPETINWAANLLKPIERGSIYYFAYLRREGKREAEKAVHAM